MITEDNLLKQKYEELLTHYKSLNDLVAMDAVELVYNVARTSSKDLSLLPRTFTDPESSYSRNERFVGIMSTVIAEFMKVNGVGTVDFVMLLKQWLTLARGHIKGAPNLHRCQNKQFVIVQHNYELSNNSLMAFLVPFLNLDWIAEMNMNCVREFLKNTTMIQKIDIVAVLDEVAFDLAVAGADSVKQLLELVNIYKEFLTDLIAEELMKEGILIPLVPSTIQPSIDSLLKELTQLNHNYNESYQQHVKSIADRWSGNAPFCLPVTKEKLLSDILGSIRQETTVLYGSEEDKNKCRTNMSKLMAIYLQLISKGVSSDLLYGFTGGCNLLGYNVEDGTTSPDAQVNFDRGLRKITNDTELASSVINYILTNFSDCAYDLGTFLYEVYCATEHIVALYDEPYVIDQTEPHIFRLRTMDTPIESVLTWTKLESGYSIQRDQKE